MQYAEAFSRYGAKLKNPQWSVCAENGQGELVVSLWQHHFSRASDNKIRCAAEASRWAGAGNSEFREHLSKAFDSGQTIRAVFARAQDTAAVERGEDASKIKKKFFVREDWFGKVVAWDGSRYEIEFEGK